MTDGNDGNGAKGAKGAKGTDAAAGPGDRLKDELRAYLEARADRAVTGLGERLGEATKQLGDPGNSLGNVLGTLSKGGEALSKGKSPGGAAASMALSHVAGGVKDKVSGLVGKITGKGGKSGKGETRGKSVVIIEDIDVGVPVRQAYDQWTQFQEFGRFAKGVVNVEQSDEVTSNWQAKVAKSNRSWQAKTLEQIPDERIVWSSEGAKGTTKGAVTFHPLGDNLTKVLLVLEYFPKGLFEKTGNIWRAQGRRARLDLKLFRKFVTMQGEPAEGWRGEIRDGEVVRDHDEAVEEEERDKERDEDEDENGEYEDDDREYEDEADEDEDEEYEDGDEEDEDRGRASGRGRRDPYRDDDEAYERELEEDGEDDWEDDDETRDDDDWDDAEDEGTYEEERPRRRAGTRR
ncbi:SRPBCC family protein [Streptomyces ficellus]|uniref:SRPBCC family protein n=1 Tax=Streptomyces ficellus TaxID=1977088 RepID=A0A6I6F4E3_9ACTN|nr:SRPBCC family protein [Streptomyces ficellus]QGV77731.1 SRPBCC family protein [Streptomyces ficellus]